MRDIVTHLAFKEAAEEAVQFYTSIFPDPRITGITHFRSRKSHLQHDQEQYR